MIAGEGMAIPTRRRLHRRISDAVLRYPEWGCFVGATWVQPINGGIWRDATSLPLASYALALHPSAYIGDLSPSRRGLTAQDVPRALARLVRERIEAAEIAQMAGTGSSRLTRARTAANNLTLNPFGRQGLQRCDKGKRCRSS